LHDISFELPKCRPSGAFGYFFFLNFTKMLLPWVYQNAAPLGLLDVSFFEFYQNVTTLGLTKCRPSGGYQNAAPLGLLDVSFFEFYQNFTTLGLPKCRPSGAFGCFF
jgi:hypothetical protein